MFVCFDHRLFTPASTPKGVDFCMHDRLHSFLKGSRAPFSGKFDMLAENLSVYEGSYGGGEEGGRECQF